MKAERLHKIVLILAKRRGDAQTSEVLNHKRVHLKLRLHTLGGNVLFPLRITLSVKCIGVQQNNITAVQPIK